MYKPSIFSNKKSANVKWTHEQEKNARLAFPNAWRQFNWNGTGFICVQVSLKMQQGSKEKSWYISVCIATHFVRCCIFSCTLRSNVRKPLVWPGAERPIIYFICICLRLYRQSIIDHHTRRHFHKPSDAGRRGLSQAQTSYWVSLAHSLSSSHEIAHPSRIFHTRFAFQIPPFY
jgi:hypothetical protein